MSNFNVKMSVPNDIPNHNGYIPKENLKTQSYLNEISSWTNKKKMKLNTDKSKIMIFNFTNNHQFTTRVNIDNVNLDVIEHKKLLGTHTRTDLSWDLNTKNLIKKKCPNAVAKKTTFSASTNDLVHIYVLFVRSVLEASSSVWHKSLTKEN